MRKYFSENYAIPSPKLDEHQKKVFAGNCSVFSPKLGEELGLFRLIIQRLNLDGGTRPPYNLSTGVIYSAMLLLVDASYPCSCCAN